MTAISCGYNNLSETDSLPESLLVKEVHGFDFLTVDNLRVENVSVKYAFGVG